MSAGVEEENGRVILYIIGGVVALFVVLMIVGGLTGRVKLQGCCGSADPARDLRMRQ